MAVPEVTIVLSSYNGERYIAEQIESILQQTFTDWELLVRDDGSTDGTRDIIRSYIEKDTRIRLMDDTRHLGIRDSFNELFIAARNRPHVMYADQDDVWLPKKIETTLFHIKQLTEEDPRRPLLVHGAYVLVDESMRRLSRKRPKPQDSLSSTLLRCPVLGCTMMINRELMELFLPIPSFAYMPDYWIALIAAAYGNSLYIEEPLLKHRLHRTNTSSGFREHTLVGRFSSFRATSNRIRKEIQQNTAFCKGLLNRSLIDTRLDNTERNISYSQDQRLTARRYLEVFQKTGLRRWAAIQRIERKGPICFTDFHTKYVMMSL